MKRAAWLLVLALACAGSWGRGPVAANPQRRARGRGGSRSIPHYTTAYISRTFGYMVFDTLFAMGQQGRHPPADWSTITRTSADGLTWQFTLRDGLKFHDGAPVTSADCIASLRRWGSRDGLGRRLLAATGVAGGDRR